MSSPLWSRGPEPAPPVIARAWIFHSEESTLRDPHEVANEINDAFGSEIASVGPDITKREVVWFGDKPLTRSGRVLLLIAAAEAKSALVLEKLEVRGG